MPAATLTAEDTLRRNIRRAGYVGEALRKIIVRIARLTVTHGPEDVRAAIVLEREEIIAEIADGVRRKPGQTDLDAYFLAWPDAEAAVDAALGIIFPEG